MSARTVERIIITCDGCGADLLDPDWEHAALFASRQNAAEVAEDLAGWHVEPLGSMGKDYCRPCAIKAGVFGDPVDEDGGQDR
jgi:hypothetical protein